MSEAPMKTEINVAAMTLRWLMICLGMVGNDILIWRNTKTTKRIPDTVKRAMILPLFQGYVTPPHCRASKKQTTAGISVTVPRGSSRMMNSDTLRLSDFWGFGVSKRTIMADKAAPPNGRLM